MSPPQSLLKKLTDWAHSMFLKAPEMLWWELAAAFSSWVSHCLDTHETHTQSALWLWVHFFKVTTVSIKNTPLVGGPDCDSEDALAGHSGGLQLKTKYLCSSLSLISASFGLYDGMWTLKNIQSQLETLWWSDTCCGSLLAGIAGATALSVFINVQFSCQFSDLPSNTQHVVKDI